MEGTEGGAARDLPVVRIGDGDRTVAISTLRTACGEGRITLDEFAERAGVVYAAVTRAELDTVTGDLPIPTPAPVGAPKRRVFAVMSGARQRGRWRVAEQTTAVAFWGGVHLDLRNALVEHPAVEIRAWAIMGGVEIIVPDGIPVEVTGGVLMGGTSNHVRDVPPLPGSPVVVVRARGLWGGVDVRSRPRPGDDPRPPLLPERPADPELTSIVEEVRSHPVDLSAQTAADGTVTILFSDIEGSSELAERLGDHRWLDLLHEHNKLIREHVAMAGGREVKAQGDGFMIAFAGAGRALRCAVDIQRALAGWRRLHRETPLHVRIGVHTGEVLAEDGDLYGKHVIVAARIASQARGGEVLASSLVRELTDASGIRFGAGRDVQLRGLERPWRLYPVQWEEA